MVKIGKEVNLLKYAFLLQIVHLIKIHGQDNIRCVMDIK